MQLNFNNIPYIIFIFISIAVSMKWITSLLSLWIDSKINGEKSSGKNFDAHFEGLIKEKKQYLKRDIPSQNNSSQVKFQDNEVKKLVDNLAWQKSDQLDKTIQAIALKNKLEIPSSHSQDVLTYLKEQFPMTLSLMSLDQCHRLIINYYLPYLCLKKIPFLARYQGEPITPGALLIGFALNDSLFIKKWDRSYLSLFLFSNYFKKEEYLEELLHSSKNWAYWTHQQKILNKIQKLSLPLNIDSKNALNFFNNSDFSQKDHKATYHFLSQIKHPDSFPNDLKGKLGEKTMSEINDEFIKIKEMYLLVKNQ